MQPAWLDCAHISSNNSTRRITCVVYDDTLDEDPKDFRSLTFYQNFFSRKSSVIKRSQMEGFSIESDAPLPFVDGGVGDGEGEFDERIGVTVPEGHD
jgi:hypothetical protein